MLKHWIQPSQRTIRHKIQLIGHAPNPAIVLQSLVKFYFAVRANLHIHFITSSPHHFITRCIHIGQLSDIKLGDRNETSNAYALDTAEGRKRIFGLADTFCASWKSKEFQHQHFKEILGRAYRGVIRDKSQRARLDCLSMFSSVTVVLLLVFAVRLSSTRATTWLLMS